MGCCYGHARQPDPAVAAEYRLTYASLDGTLRVQGTGSPSPLIDVPGIIVTPHMATFSRESMERVALAAATSVIAALSGERPPGLVNPDICPTV